MNCNCTEEIVNQKMLVYSHCASIQTANYLLSKTTMNLYHIVIAIYNANMTGCIDHSPKASEMIINDYDGTEEWCILR